MTSSNSVQIAVNGGISFGSKLTTQQLLMLSTYLSTDTEIELTTFQQLYIWVPKERLNEIIKKFEQEGLYCYPVGNYVKSLRTCNFCKGYEEEGMPVAIELNRRIAGIPVPFTLKPAYTGCPIGCGEPMVADLGVMKMQNSYNLYVGGKSKGLDASVGVLVYEKLTPEELFEHAEKMIHYYAQNGRRREAFSKFIQRIGLQDFLENAIVFEKNDAN